MLLAICIVKQMDLMDLISYLRILLAIWTCHECPNAVLHLHYNICIEVK